MTSLLSGPVRSEARAAADARHRRPLVLLAVLGGAAAAASTLVVCLAVGVVGWFLTDAGSHGAPRDGLRAGAVAWLMGHGSGLVVDGVRITAIPLGISVICAWSVWRIAHRVGDSVSGHGPDADALADGARDWTVPAASLLFAAAYAGVAVVVLRAVAGAGSPSGGRVVAWSVLLSLVVGGLSIAIGAGRAAIWTAFLPLSLRAASTVCLKVVSRLLLVSAATFLVALAVDLGAALNVMSELHTDAGAATLYSGVSLAVLPNAVLLAASYLLGPGFAVGTATIASPTAVVLGPVPAFPLLAALPDDGQPAGWVALLLLVPPLVAAYAAARVHRLYPTTRWEEGAVRGCAGGILAGLVVGALTALAGGSVGPGRMQDVGAVAGLVTLHAVVSLGLGALVGALWATWSYRRHVRRMDVPQVAP
ncbi:hypothetical protein ISU07_20570 [Nocardioides islandensis]|uniref:Uncharacterized protein n=1 Tax=Nocardioides islandensis TaxID=433663 RepID=A0A930VJ50_9ACTN|nr:DUF6350 family protein [Nocardioides islandensis]MBF4765531.1 hypothetical protein [Nocardioides islandensis]